MKSSASKSLQNFANAIFSLVHAATPTQRDGLHFPRRAFEIVIDDDEIITCVIQNFLPRTFQPALDLVFGILATRSDPVFQILPRWRQHEDRLRLGKLFLYLQRALHINFENEVLFL